ncbi:Fructose-1-6-bisphosphatase class 1/Sedoheputulose-1-7-bisphosphatase [Penicillium desertorum]|uniref:Fructose-1,6-bisphosphatase n=1 Tax=Penicillium desertorum TaxID=1303715 RepID=A0A9X0BPR1_9EURO|nr:Fructose-1-6-bisphosphatase class 1/Sedoheputulose-1-7-bisphosphatase [Penicillium desertorum]
MTKTGLRSLPYFYPSKLNCYTPFNRYTLDPPNTPNTPKCLQHPPVGAENINTDIVTLSRFFTEEQIKYPEASGDFTLLCHALQFSFKSIAYYIRRASLINLTGLAGSSNMTGDDQKKLDVIGNDIFISAMRGSGKCRIVVSEEEEEVIRFDEHPNARYAVVCDPIDGSSNLDAGVSVGTIFGIFQLPDEVLGPNKSVGPEDLLHPGTSLVASGFTMYGASAQLVITMRGGGVNGFTLENSLGDQYWDEWCNAYFHSLKYPENGGKPYSARYIGSMVADAYRTLLYGGIFAYPADSKSPKGKLRILYECAPMAMVFENAGGLAVNSRMERLMEVVPENIHDKSGVFLGSRDEVQKVIDMYNKYKK